LQSKFFASVGNDYIIPHSAQIFSSGKNL